MFYEEHFRFSESCCETFGFDVMQGFTTINIRFISACILCKVANRTVCSDLIKFMKRDRVFMKMRLKGDLLPLTIL